MTTSAYRIHKSQFAASSGEGARLYGGRWNPPGIEVIYASSHVSLAVLENLVHWSANNDPDGYSITEIRIPATVQQLAGPLRVLSFDFLGIAPVELSRAEEELRTRIEKAAASVGHAIDDDPEEQFAGAVWAFEKMSAVLNVPSVVLPDWVDERNYVINPQHPDFAQIEFGEPRPFPIDARLLAHR